MDLIDWLMTFKHSGGIEARKAEVINRFNFFFVSWLFQPSRFYTVDLDDLLKCKAEQLRPEGPSEWNVLTFFWFLDSFNHLGSKLWIWVKHFKQSGAIRVQRTKWVNCFNFWREVLDSFNHLGCTLWFWIIILF